MCCYLFLFAYYEIFKSHCVGQTRAECYNVTSVAACYIYEDFISFYNLVKVNLL